MVSALCDSPAVIFAIIARTVSFETFPSLSGLFNHTPQRTGRWLIPLWDANRQPQSQPALQLVISTGRTAPIWARRRREARREPRRPNDGDYPAAEHDVAANSMLNSITARLLHRSVSLSDSSHDRCATTAEGLFKPVDH